MTKCDPNCLQIVLLSERKCLYAVGLFITLSICFKEIGGAGFIVFKCDTKRKVEI